MIVIKRRIVAFLIISTVIFGGLIGRLAQIQLIDTESFSSHQINLIEESVEQRTHSLVLNDGRGRILDRNGQLLSNDYNASLVIFPFASEFPDQLKKVANILGISDDKLIHLAENADRPFVYHNKDLPSLTDEQMATINDLKAPGIFAQYVESKDLTPFANHFLGVVRENPEKIKEEYTDKLEKGLISIKTMTGISGVEAAFDQFLISEGESKLIYHVTRGGEPLFGLDVKYAAPANPFYPVELKTTLDKPMQEIVESAFVTSGIKEGGAILLDIENSNVLAMVSRPLFSEDYPMKDGTANKTLLTWKPGSVFKIVTAAAAIETNQVDPNRKFDCNQNAYGDGIDESRKLGMLTFDESFAQSCNYTFGTLAKEMMAKDPDILERYAKMLGLVDLSGWEGNVFHLENFSHFPREEAGQVWAEDTAKSSKAIVQTAIGQLNVRLSPLAVANMMATIARGGEFKEARAATEVMYQNGTTLTSFPEHEKHVEGLSRYTFKRLKELLSGVVESPYGTGRSLQGLSYTVAGKSGTAELGANEESENKDGAVNSWFAGYFPTDHPMYALVVFELDHKGRQKVQGVYKEVIQNLYSLNHKK